MKLILVSIVFLLFSKLGPFFSRTGRRVYRHSDVKARVVDLIRAVLFLERDELLEAMTPQDLVDQIRAARLGGHARALDDALQNDGELEAFFTQVFGRNRPQWTVLVDDVLDSERPDEKETV